MSAGLNRCKSWHDTPCFTSGPSKYKSKKSKMRMNIGSNEIDNGTKA